MDEGIRARLGLPASKPDQTRHNLRVFGCCLAVLLSLLAVLAWRRASRLAPVELILAVVAALLAGVKPAALASIYNPWTKAAGMIGKVNSYLAMALIYYLVITPYGAVMRLMGIDLLDERLRDRDSYWHARQSTPDAQSYQNQF